MIRTVKLISRTIPGYASHVVVVDATTGRRICRTDEFADPILARAAAIELATSRGWEVASRNYTGVA